MTRWILALLLALAQAAHAQVTTTQGETKQLCRLWDGTDVLAIDGSGNITCNAGTGTFTVSGTVTANAGTNLNTSALLTTAAHDAAFGTAGSADAQVRTIQGVASMTPVQVSQATASNLNATVTDGSGALTVDGTVTVTDGSGALNVIVDSGTLSISESGVTADVFDLTNSNPLACAITDGDGTQITSFGGGVQYTDGDTDATPTGTVGMWFTGANTLVATSQANPLPVEIAGPLVATNVATDLSSIGGVALATSSGSMPVDGAYNDGLIACNQSAAISVSSSGNNEIVALTTDNVIYVCSFSLVVRGTVEVQWIYGTGTACATDETNLTGPYSFQVREGISQGSGLGTLFRTAASNALCLELSGAVQVDGVVSYRKFEP